MCSCSVTRTYDLEYNGKTFVQVSEDKASRYLLSHEERQQLCTSLNMAKIGSFKGSKYIITVAAPTTITYDFQGTTKTVDVCYADQAAATASSSRNLNDWKNNVLFKGNFFPITLTYIETFISTYPLSEAQHIVNGSQEIADLATLFSSCGQGFTYDASKCQLWVKPNYFRLWLEKAKSASWTEARIVMHGMRSGQYDKLASDIAGFDFNFSAHGAKKWGFYCSCSDHIASDYHSGSQPRGTACIGLLLCTRKMGVNDASFEHYALGGCGYSQYGNTKDAYAVRDQFLYLPLGLAHAA